MNIEQVNSKEEKMYVCRTILEALPEWFEIEEGKERYTTESAEQIFIKAVENNKVVGFISLKETGKATVELAVMGVLKEYHRKGIGSKLFEEAKKVALSSGYSFIQVKTVQMGKYEDYDRTNMFYLSLGFKEFEVISQLWDEDNPCQIYVMAL